MVLSTSVVFVKSMVASSGSLSVAMKSEEGGGGGGLNQSCLVCIIPCKYTGVCTDVESGMITVK